MDKILKQLKENYKHLSEGMFGFGGGTSTKYNSIEAIQDRIQKALNKEDGLTFRFFYGKGIKLACGVSDLIGLDWYVRPGAAILEKDEHLQMVSVETQASFQVFCVDDEERRKMRLFVSTIDPREMINRLPHLEENLQFLNDSGIEDLHVKGYGKSVVEWLESFSNPV